MLGVSTKNLLVGMMVLLVAFAGCTGKDDSKGEGVKNTEPVKVGTSADTGAILGSVMDDEQLPIGGAQAGLLDMPEIPATSTNDLGEFGFSDLPPGTYRVQVSRLGYDSAPPATVDVVAGEISDLPIVLQRMATIEPYSVPLQETSKVFLSAGYNFAGCAPPAPLGPGDICNSWTVSDAESVSQHLWEIGDNETSKLETIIVELAWQAQSGACKSEFLLDIVAPGVDTSNGLSSSETRAWAAENHISPMKIRIDRAQMIEAGVMEEDDYKGKDSGADGDWRTRIFARPGGTSNNDMADVGCSVEQPFTIYVTTFYNGPASDIYTAVTV